ncbi:MAG: hypothetical protein ACXADY_11840 [Candidatus Hodarchaeales archaeon]|jgi:hypothetical protein
MSERFWFVAAWKYTSTKGRVILAFGFFSLLTIFFGAILMFIGIIGLFTIIGASHPNTDNVLQLLFSGFLFMCGGVVGMVIYLIGMSFIPPPILPQEENNN